MSDNGSILVLNAGSSSLKFSLFRAVGAAELQLAVRGQIDGVGTLPHLKAKDAAGAALVDLDCTVAEVGTLPDAIKLAGACVLFRIQIAKTEILQLPLDLPNAQAVGERCKDIKSLLGDPLSLMFGHGAQGAHIVQAVGQLE